MRPTSTLPSLAALVASLVLSPATARAQTLSVPNDGSAEIDLAPAFPDGLSFFGHHATHAWINENGNVTFGLDPSAPNTGFAQGTPVAFPGAPQPILAPYWADVDTRGDHTGGVDTVIYSVARDGLDVRWQQVDYADASLGGHAARNDFEMILRVPAAVCAPGDFDLQFIYRACNWTTADTSGGTGGLGGSPAVAGFDAADGVHSWLLPGSGTMDVLHACTTSNVGMPGIWRYRFRQSESCPGAGDPCVDPSDPSRVGACRQGHVVCTAGQAACVADTSATPERCDGVDNDCNGEVDDGPSPDALCGGGGYACVAGACVRECTTGACPAGETCLPSGACVSTACAAVTCPDAQQCVDGACVDPCARIDCPTPLVCRAGRCLDPCAGVACPAGLSCSVGRCVAPCGCVGCGTGMDCGSDGRCVPAGCESVHCAAGTVCLDGHCVDGCVPSPGRTVCGPLQHCEASTCVDGPAPPVTDAGTDADAAPDVAPNGPPDAAPDATMRDAGPSADAGETPRRDGCGCRTLPARSAPSVTALLALAALAGARRRRRPR